MIRTPFRSTLRPLALAAALALGATATMTASAQNAPHMMTTDGTLLSVSAQAEAKRVPDIATVSTGVVTQAADANSAMRANADQMAKVIAEIKAAGVAERDIQTSGISLGPQYHYAPDKPPAITGYQATNTVTITARDISKLGKLLDALVATGANQVYGPNFDVDDKESAYDEARRNAIKLAQQRAEMYAKTLGMRVRRIVSISEGGGGGRPGPIPMMAMARAEKAADTQVEPGETTLSVNLDVVFELGR